MCFLVPLIGNTLSADNLLVPVNKVSNLKLLCFLPFNKESIFDVALFIPDSGNVATCVFLFFLPLRFHEILYEYFIYSS